MRVAIILGSSSKHGDTRLLADRIVEQRAFDLYDLNDYRLSFYDYDHHNKGDDFLPLIRKLILEYDTLLFATPVYWYAMSGIMKVFFDRITDLLDEEKDLGRKLRGKNMAVISSSNGNHLGEHFWLPFQASAAYLGMHYLGHLHTIRDAVDREELKAWLSIFDAKASG